MTRPRRPMLRYHGGKYRLASWIISHFPPHKIYVEPYGGAASVLLAKERSYGEVLNDIESDIYNFYWVMHHHWKELRDLLSMTPFSRRELELASVFHPNPIERARRMVVRSFMGFGADTVSDMTRSTGFRSNSNRSHTIPAHDWVNYSDHIHEIAERIKGVVIECRPAVEVMKQHDTKDTLHYLDPPYQKETRKRFGVYKHEMTDDAHIELLTLAMNLKGYVIVSGYRSGLYDHTLKNWHRVEREALADGAQKRIECLWIKPEEGLNAQKSNRAEARGTSETNARLSKRHEVHTDNDSEMDRPSQLEAEPQGSFELYGELARRGDDSLAGPEEENAEPKIRSDGIIGS